MNKCWSLRSLGALKLIMKGLVALTVVWSEPGQGHRTTSVNFRFIDPVVPYQSFTFRWYYGNVHKHVLCTHTDIYA